MAVDKGIMLSKSPYFITEIGSTGFTSSIEIRVWNGDINIEPTGTTVSGTTYTLQKQALTPTTTVVVFEVAKIINSVFDHLGDVYDLNASGRTDALWVNIKSFDGDVNRDDTWLALDGYSNFTDGINYDLDTPILMSERIIYHYDGIDIRIPLYCDGPFNAAKALFKKNGATIATQNFVSLTASTFSYDKVQYITQTGATGAYDSVVIVDIADNPLDTITIVPRDCKRYTPYVCSFINGYGVNQEFIFGLASKEKTEVKKEDYNRQTLQIVNGVPTYNTLRHQTKEFNSSVTKSITLNSDYIDESLNNTLTELISSEYVWLTSNNLMSPVNVSSKSLDYKTSINNGLINYKVDFDYAYYTRNSVY